MELSEYSDRQLYLKCVPGVGRDQWIDRNFWFSPEEVEPLPDEFGDLDEASKKLYLEL